MSGTNPYLDLKGVLNIQKDYLGNLSATGQDADVVNAIQQNLTAMYTDYAASNQSTNSVLTQQDKVLDIVAAEKQRLMDKKQGVDNAVFGKKRAVELNNSNRLRQNSYTNLIIILITTLVAFIGIMLLSSYLTMVPQVVFDLLSIIVISVGIYISLYTFLDIQSRNNMNFNELSLPGLNNKSIGNTIPGTQGSMKNLITGDTGCVGSDCCGTDTIWDQEAGTCKKESFSTIMFSYINGEITTEPRLVSSNSPNEFEKYTPVN